MQFGVVLYNIINPVNITYRNLPTIKPKKQEAKATEEKAQESVNSNLPQTPDVLDERQKRREFPNGNAVAIDYAKNKINISQILTDFRSTISAIATPPKIMEEIEGYLKIIDTESAKETPNKDIIRTNLKYASQIADNYISETLEKESKVVENWIDALFLQRIVYKANPEDINETYKIKIEKSAKIEDAKQRGLEAKEQKEQYKNDFITVLKEAKAEKTDLKLAFGKYTEALNIAKKLENANYIAAAHLERAKILDKCDYPRLAVSEFARATNCDDHNIKTHAHLGLAQIYDDYGEFEGAKENYHEAVAQSGEGNNMAGQTLALKGLGTLYANKFDLANTQMFNDLALVSMEDVQNENIKARTYKKIADDYSYLGENKKALNYLKLSTEIFNNHENKALRAENLEKNYAMASDLMEKLGNEPKAKSLLLKARLAKLSA